MFNYDDEFLGSKIYRFVATTGGSTSCEQNVDNLWKYEHFYSLM